MNLRQTETGEEAKTKAQAWYHNPETPLPQPLTTATQAPVSTQEPLPAPSPALFDPSAAERILARAGALQEVHGQMLSQEQIEAVAQEIGIKPEFVRLAIEQNKNGVVLEERETDTLVANAEADKLALKRTADVLIGYSLFLVMAAAVIQYASQMAPLYPLREQLVRWFVFYLPSLLAVILGAFSPRRRFGAVTGAALAVTVILTATIGYNLGGASRWFLVGDLPFFATMIGTGALLGAAGAQARRVVSRRQASNRSSKSRRTGK